MSLYSYSSNPGDMLVDFPFEEMIESISTFFIYNQELPALSWHLQYVVNEDYAKVAVFVVHRRDGIFKDFSAVRDFYTLVITLVGEGERTHIHFMVSNSRNENYYKQLHRGQVPNWSLFSAAPRKVFEEFFDAIRPYIIPQDVIPQDDADSGKTE